MPHNPPPDRPIVPPPAPPLPPKSREQQAMLAILENLAWQMGVTKVFLEELAELLRSIEWHGDVVDGFPVCPACCANQGASHDEDCKLALALARLKTLPPVLFEGGRVSDLAFLHEQMKRKTRGNEP